VTATVRTITITFYLVRRDAQPFSIFPPPCVDNVAAHPNFCRIAVGLIAARLLRLIGHKPRRVELLVQREIGARMRPMFLGVYRLTCCDGKKRNEIPQREPSPERNFPAKRRLTPGMLIRKVSLGSDSRRHPLNSSRRSAPLPLPHSALGSGGDSPNHGASPCVVAHGPISTVEFGAADRGTSVVSDSWLHQFGHILPCPKGQ